MPINYTHCYNPDTESADAMRTFYNYLSTGMHDDLCIDATGDTCEKPQGLIRAELIEKQADALSLSAEAGLCHIFQVTKNLPYSGVGVWTEWKNGTDVIEFWRSILHISISSYFREEKSGPESHTWLLLSNYRSEREFFSGLPVKRMLDEFIANNLHVEICNSIIHRYSGSGMSIPAAVMVSPDLNNESASHHRYLVF